MGAEGRGWEAAGRDKEKGAVRAVKLLKGLRLGRRLGDARQNKRLVGPSNTPVRDRLGGERLTEAVLDFLENTRGEGRRPSRPPARNGLGAGVGRVGGNLFLFF